MNLINEHLAGGADCTNTIRTPGSFPAIKARVCEREIACAPPALALFRQLTGDGRRKHVALLESAEPTSRQTQRSLLVVSAALHIVCRGSEVVIEAVNGNGAPLLPLLAEQLHGFDPQQQANRLRLHVARGTPHGSDRQRLRQDSVLSVLRTLIEDVYTETGTAADAVFLAGVFGYDLAGHFEDLPEATRDNGFPDYTFVLADCVIDIDHLAQRTRVFTSVFGEADLEARLAAARAQVASTANAACLLADAAHDTRESPSQSARANDRAPFSASARSRPLSNSSDATSDRSDAEFCADVVALKHHVIAGDVFQIVPSRTFSLPCRDAMSAYAALAALNPSPYLFYFNSVDFTLFGASPESAVKVNGRTRRVEISPIAGTRPRGFDADGHIDADLDSRYEAELRLDEKENAEHMMLLDLARNDIARIAETGTREVTELLHVVRYSHVMHLASRVGGVLRNGLDALHACQACFNMGTLTGAPKIRAMQLLRGHEPARRGHYGGAIGYLRGDGSLDTAIVIRAALVQDGVAQVRAGAGVVHDSVPALEADETRRKAEAVLRAIALANAESGQTQEATDDL